MKFLYEYRTSANELRRGELNAATRDAAYSLLKSQGIRPSRLAEAPGFLNKLFGKGKRWLVIAVLCALLVALLVAFVGADRRAARTMHEARSAMDVFDSPTRRQPIGDAAVIAEGIRTGWADVFAEEGDRFLASFAIPGVEAGQRNTTEAEIRKALASQSAESVPAPADTIEARQIRAMVGGMKQELREFLEDGGSIAQYGKLLVARQDQELEYYRRALNEITELVKAKTDRETVDRTLAARNAALRKMGIRPLVMPTVSADEK